MTTKCGFCKGTGIEPGHIDCVWCDNTGRDHGIQPDNIKRACAEIRAVHERQNAVEVKRYTADERYPGQYSARCDVVAASDYDVAVSVGTAFGNTLERVVAERDALQQRLTAADERADVLEGLLRLARGAIGENQWTLLTKDIDAMLSQDAQRTNNSGNAHCPHDGICHTSDETCAEARARIDSVKPAEGCGDVL